jgi:drug/metabolite transporter (DMT)-like permease
VRTAGSDVNPPAGGALTPPVGHSTAAVIFSLLAVYLAWGSTYLAIRVALTSLPPFLLAGGRGIVAGALLLAWARLRNHDTVSLAALRNAAFVGVLLVGGGNGLVTYAEQWVSSGLAAAIASSGSIWIVVILAFLGERTTGGEKLGIVIGFTGIVLLNADGELRGSPAGAVALLFATLSWAAGSVLTRRLVLPEGMMLAAVELFAGGLVTTLFGLAIGERIVEADLTTRGVTAWIYLVFAGSIVGFTAFTFLMRNVRPALATSFVYVNPIVAVGLGVLLGGEQVSSLGYAGVAVCVLGIAVVTIAHRSGR